jgi:hypothetical protein
MANAWHRLGRGMLVRMAHVICDADASLEDMKGRHRCRERGCLTVGDECVAYRQAKAVARLVREEREVAARPTTIKLAS